MDQFLPTRYTQEINADTGERYVAWESTFESIRDKWEAALEIGSKKPVGQEEMNALLDAEKKRQATLVPDFIKGMQGALEQSLKGVNGDYQWRDMTNSSTPSTPTLDRGQQAYEAALAEERSERREISNYQMELVNMARQMSGANNLMNLL